MVFILRQRSDVVTDDIRKSSATTPSTEENTTLLRHTELSDSAARGTAKKNKMADVHVVGKVLHMTVSWKC